MCQHGKGSRVTNPLWSPSRSGGTGVSVSSLQYKPAEVKMQRFQRRRVKVCIDEGILGAVKSARHLCRLY